MGYEVVKEVPDVVWYWYSQVGSPSTAITGCSFRRFLRQSVDHPVLGIVNAFTKGFCMGKDGYSSLLPRFSPSLEVVSLVGSFRGSPICFPSKDDLEEIQGDRLFAAGNFFLVEIAVRCGLETEWIG